MRVEELIKVLEQYPKDANVYLGGYECGTEMLCTYIHNNENDEPVLDFY